MPNHLMNETSPYLLQHAHNPVDWYPWGDVALQKALDEDKPIFLSIGYSACHWCHVMAHESFEDERVAAILNEHFVNIKVDREERPDLDQIYMNAVQAMTGRGGWPMSVFLTPDGHPFYSGTYFPPKRRYGMPAFAEVLLAVADAWRNRREELVEGSRRITDLIERSGGAPEERAEIALEPGTLDAAYAVLRQGFDERHGGWDGAPKFPQPMVLEFLLRYGNHGEDGEALRMVTRTLDAMARGGLYDQIGGGFHRYSVDERWLVPHFEKMLYDNAQLARVYLHAWQVTGDPFYRAIVEETLDFVQREMVNPQGGFYATQDADSEGEEGKFYLWSADEVREVLGPQADPFMQFHGVTRAGNFEGQNILTFSGSFEQRRALEDERRRLLAARERRTRPDRDEKVLVAWNGLMLAAFAEAAQALERQDYRQTAERNADFLLRALRTASGRLFHTWNWGQAKLNAYLEDYTHLAEGLLALYEASFEPRWYLAAHDLMQQAMAHFGAPDGGFFDTSDDHETLIVRPRDLQDNAVPSGNAVAATVLLRLADLAVEPGYADLARHSLTLVHGWLGRHPLAFGQWLTALHDLFTPGQEVAIAGDPQADDTQRLLIVATAGYHPERTLAVEQPDGEAVVPLMRGRVPLGGRATAYVCSGETCLPPVTDEAKLEQQLTQRS